MYVGKKAERKGREKREESDKVRDNEMEGRKEWEKEEKKTGERPLKPNERNKKWANEGERQVGKVASSPICKYNVILLEMMKAIIFKNQKLPVTLCTLCS